MVCRRLLLLSDPVRLNMIDLPELDQVRIFDRCLSLRLPAACPGGYFTPTTDRPHLVAGRLGVGTDAPDPGPNLGNFFNFRQALSACANPVQTVP